MYFNLKVIINGVTVFAGTESGFSSAANAELVLRSRYQHLLPEGYERCWQMIQVEVK